MWKNTEEINKRLDKIKLVTRTRKLFTLESLKSLNNLLQFDFSLKQILNMHPYILMFYDNTSNTNDIQSNFKLKVLTFT